MTSDDAGLSLEEGFSRTGMTIQELWLRQLTLGGDADPLEVEAYVLNLLVADPYQHDLLAQGLNEWSIEHGDDHPVAYWRTNTMECSRSGNRRWRSPAHPVRT